MPETVGGIDSGPREGTVEFGGVDVAEFVGADGGVAEIGREDGHRECGHGVVEEGLLLGWLNGVELGIGETDESVGLSI